MVYCSSSVAPVLALSFVVPPVSSISCRSWLHQYLSFVTPVSSPVATSGSIGCRLWLQSSVSVVRLWLQPPVSVACGSSVCCSWLQSPVLALLSFVAPGVSVVRGSGISSCICRLVMWLQYLLCGSPVPLSVACGSSGCRSWLQSSVSVVAPVSVVRGSGISCCLVLWLLWLQQWLKYYLLSLPVAPSCLSLLLWLSSLLVLWLL